MTAPLDPLDRHIKSTREQLSVFSDHRPEVLEQFDRFVQDLRKLILNQDLSAILDALLFAAEKHRFQKRKGPQAYPYIIHPIGVAHHLLTIGNVTDRDVLIAALLHDTVEDTNTTFEEISKAFGLRVESFVREVTDDKNLPKAERKRMQIVNAPHKSSEAAQIKLADKYFNLKDLATSPPINWTEERIDEYFRWAQQVVDNLPAVNAPLKTAFDELIRKNTRMAG